MWLILLCACDLQWVMISSLALWSLYQYLGSRFSGKKEREHFVKKSLKVFPQNVKIGLFVKVLSHESCYGTVYLLSRKYL